MKTIVLFGSGKSATVLIDYLKQLASDGLCHVIIADADLNLLQEKVGNSASVSIFQIDITDELQRNSLIEMANVVISLMPPSLHYLVAISCMQLKKHLLTASYIDDATKKLAPKIEEANILFLYEMGLDPGIDHMSAMQMIDTIHDNGGKITSFKSHCGGLVAPESDDNPWHYKVSWNPKNIVLAGKVGALYLNNGNEEIQTYTSLFKNCKQTHIEGLGHLAYYPNRDSLTYIKTYDLKDVKTFIRTTLRHPDFCSAWQQIVTLGLTDEEQKSETDGVTISDFFTQYLQSIDKKEKDELEKSPLKKQFDFLFNDCETLINKGFCNASTILQFIIEHKLLLQATDKDMVVMQHEIEYEEIRDKKQNSAYKKLITSTLIVKGEDNLHTAMAKTVGLTLGIVAKLIIEEKLVLTGLHIPTKKEIYMPVLEALKHFGVEFNDKTTNL